MFEALQLMAHHGLGQWAARYLAERVYGVQSSNTLEAKSRDLALFVRWYVAAKGNGDIGFWTPDDTQMYLASLKAQNLAAATVARQLATLRHFARFVHEQPGAVFKRHGLPTRDIVFRVGMAQLPTPLRQEEIQRLFVAADECVLNDQRKNSRPRRNRAILTCLFLSGVRVSELIKLRLEQYQTEHLLDVVRKGNKRTQCLALTLQCRTALDDYLRFERLIDDPQRMLQPLFLPGSDRFMTRQQIGKIIEQLASVACVDQISPSRLRHTLGYALQQNTGSEVLSASVLGHVGTQYISRYSPRT
jgi:integrase/recombinase XerD